MTVKHKTYKFRLYPNNEQKILFIKTFGCARAIWNMMLADKIKYYQETGQTLNNTPAQYKNDFPWLKEVDSLALANVQLNLQKAYKNFFQSGFGFPKFKSKRNKQSYRTYNQNGLINIENGKIKLPKIGWVPLKQHREIAGVIKSATISMTNTGKYYISILCETEILPLPKTNSNVGIDLGLSHFAILSTGEKVGNEQFLKKFSKKLAKEQKILSRRALLAKQSGKNLSECMNYQKQRIKVAKIHEKIANMRKDFLNKLSTEIIKNHDIICELCMSTEYINHGFIILEDENGVKFYIPLWNYYGCGYYDEIYINNIVDFSAWLQEQDIEPITDDEFYRLEELLELYKKGQ